MGAVYFSIDPGLLNLLQKVLPIDVFVETGTFHGEAIEIAQTYFKDIYSIELSEDFYKKAILKYRSNENIHIYHGDSGEVLKQLVPSLIDRSIVYWLDAHWCMTDTSAGLLSQCPLLAELAAIQTLNKNSVIIIDDARLFLAPPPIPHEISQWPCITDIVQRLFQLSDTHCLMILNDYCLFIPNKIKTVVRQYAHSHSIDWLSVLDKSRDYNKLLSQLKEKEEALQTKEQEIQNKKFEMQCKEEEIIILKQKNDECEKLIARLARYKKISNQSAILLGHFKNLYSKLIRSLKNPFSPKLGKLVCYSERPIFIPKYYNKCSKSLSIVPSISVTTPSYNQDKFIERTIKSVLNQRYPKLEYVIQDGCSTDETFSILERYNDSIISWQSVKDTGQANAINRGFHRTSGEIMAYLNSDDLYLPGTLNYVARFFMQHPEIDVVYGHRILINERDNEIGRWVLPPHDKEVLLWADYIPQETLFWRRSIWEKVGGYLDENFFFAMDWDLLLRFREASAKFARLPRFLGAFRIHEQQKTFAQLDIGKKEMQKLRYRVHQRHVTYTEIRKNIAKYLYKHVCYQKLYHLGLLKY